MFTRPFPQHCAHRSGLLSPARRSLLVQKGWAESHVASCYAAPHSYLFEVLLAKIPGRPWCLTPHISLNFPPDGIFTFIFPGPLLLSKTTISLQEPFFSALPLSFRPQDPSFPTLNRKTLQKQMSDQPHI